MSHVCDVTTIIFSGWDLSGDGKRTKNSYFLLGEKKDGVVT